MSTAVEVISGQGVQNAAAIVRAAKSVGLEVAIAAAIIQKESNGANVYGHDRGGVFSSVGLGKPADNRVTADNFADFRRRIDRPGAISNGVGPAQITWKGYFPDAEAKGYKLWQAEDNIRYGLGLFASHLRGSGDIVEAGHAYNGARQYGVDLAGMVAGWRRRLSGASLEVPVGEMESPTPAPRREESMYVVFVDQIGHLLITPTFVRKIVELPNASARDTVNGLEKLTKPVTVLPFPELYGIWSNVNAGTKDDSATGREIRALAEQIAGSR